MSNVALLPKATCKKDLRARSESGGLFYHGLNSYSLQANNRQPRTMAGWIAKLDEFLKLAGRAVLDHAGRVSQEQARLHADAEYARFNAARLQQPAAVDAAFDAAVAKTQVLARGRKGKA